MLALGYTVIPTIAVILGAAVASVRRPGDAFISAMQHLAAGVVFAAAATEILPQVMHQADPVATFVGAALGVALMLALKSFEARFRGPAVLLGAIGVDIFVDGLVLGLAFVAGAKAGILLTFALTLEVLFLGIVLTTELGETIASRIRIILVIAGLSLFMPLGALAALPVATFSAPVIAGFLSFGLMALLYLVTEELLVEAHTKPDSPLISAMFFAGFIGLLLIEEALG